LKPLVSPPSGIIALRHRWPTFAWKIKLGFRHVPEKRALFLRPGGHQLYRGRRTLADFSFLIRAPVRARNLAWIAHPTRACRAYFIGKFTYDGR
jgi:hypothetical protein